MVVSKEGNTSTIYNSHFVTRDHCSCLWGIPMYQPVTSDGFVFYFYFVWFKENHLSKINGDLTLTSKKQKVVGHSRGLHPSQECLYLNMMQIFQKCRVTP